MALLKETIVGPLPYYRQLTDYRVEGDTQGQHLAID